MSTVRSIERRLYVRRQLDRDLAAQAAVSVAEVPRHMEWNGIWTGYMTFAGVAIILLSFVLAVGFSSLNPLSAASWAGVGRGTAVWSAIMVLIATFLGCWVAGRTPRTTKKHGMMRGITLWGMILLTVLFAAGWVGTTAASAAGSVAGAAITPSTGVSAMQGVLQSNGVTVTRAQATTISTQLLAGDRAGAANTLASDANISNARANQILGQVTSPVGGAATSAGQAVKTGGASISWGIFWIALIGLGCALLGGAMGGGGVNLRRNRAAPLPAA